MTGSRLLTPAGHVEAKGRNGYFRVKTVMLQPFDCSPNRPTDEVGLHFLSNRSVFPGPCWVSLPVSDAKRLHTHLGQLLAEMEARR